MELFIIIASFSIASLTCFLSKNRLLIEVVSLTSSAIAFLISIFISLNVSSLGTYTPFPLFSVDALGSIVLLVIALVGTAAAIYSVFYLREETKKQIIGFRRTRQYFTLLNLFLAAMFLAVISNNPILTWISIEATTLVTAFLISFYNKPSAIEAAWKYLIINSVGLLLGFFGTLLYFTSTQYLGSNEFITWDTLASAAKNIDPIIAKIAFIFVLVGYGTKVGLFPMHTWLPDAHSKAPVPISALLSGVLLNVAMVALLRFKYITDVALGTKFSENLMLPFGVLSILIAALIIFTQKNYKRLLAYSSIENMGIITLGFGLGGLGSLFAILHMVYHALIKSALFFLSGNLFLKYSTTNISDVKGAMAAIPFTSVLFFVGFLAITGTPPFGLFLTKTYILSAGIGTHPTTIILTLFSFIILFTGFLKHSTQMLFGDKPLELNSGETNKYLNILPFILIAAALYLSIYIPSFIQTLVNAAAEKYSL